MFKKILFTVLIALPLSVFAQDAKIAHVKYQELIEAMPELDNVEKQIADLNTQWKTVLNKMQDEYTAKLKEYQEKIIISNKEYLLNLNKKYTFLLKRNGEING